MIYDFELTIDQLLKHVYFTSPRIYFGIWHTMRRDPETGSGWRDQYL